MCIQNHNEVGWIRLYRKITEWQWYGVPNVMAVFIHLLLSANHRDGYCYGKPIKRGQVLTSQDKIMCCIDIKRGALRECLKKLEESGNIIIETTNRHSLITICNYDSYQGGNESDNQPAASEQPTNRQQTKGQTGAQAEPQTDTPTTTNKNNKNNKNENNERKEEEIDSKELSMSEAEAEFERFRKAYIGTKRGHDIELADFKRKHKNWKAIVPLLMPALERMMQWREHQERTGGFVPQLPHLKTWLSQSRWETEYETDKSATPNGNNNRPYQQNGVPPAEYGIILPDEPE